MIRTPLDLHFDLIDGEGLHRGEIEVQVGDSGSIETVFVGGVKVVNQVDVREFVALLLGQGFLLTKWDTHRQAVERDYQKDDDPPPSQRS